MSRWTRAVGVGIVSVLAFGTGARCGSAEDEREAVLTGLLEELVPPGATPSAIRFGNCKAGGPEKSCAFVFLTFADNEPFDARHRAMADGASGVGATLLDSRKSDDLLEYYQMPDGRFVALMVHEDVKGCPAPDPDPEAPLLFCLDHIGLYAADAKPIGIRANN